MTAPAAQWRWRGTAGDSDANNNLFRNSLVRDGPLLVSPRHWLAVVLASCLPPEANGRVFVTMRLTTFVFLPAVQLSPAAARVYLPFFVLLKPLGKLLQALIETKGLVNPAKRLLRSHFFDAP